MDTDVENSKPHRNYPEHIKHNRFHGTRGAGLDPITRLIGQSHVNPLTGCYLLTKKPTSDGYCQIRVDGKLVTAHRFAWELLCGAIPEGMTLDHECERRECWNPSHLKVVTGAENTRLGAARRKLKPLLSLLTAALTSSLIPADQVA